LLGFLRKNPENPPPKFFPYKKFPNPSLKKFLATPLQEGIEMIIPEKL